MGTKEVPQHWVTTCDCCKKEVTLNHTGRPSKWVSIKAEQDALDYQGNHVADASVTLMLCGRCGAEVVTAMNIAIMGLMNKHKEAKT